MTAIPGRFGTNCTITALLGGSVYHVHYAIMPFDMQVQTRLKEMTKVVIHPEGNTNFCAKLFTILVVVFHCEPKMPSLMWHLRKSQETQRVIEIHALIPAQNVIAIHPTVAKILQPVVARPILLFIEPRHREI